MTRPHTCHAIWCNTACPPAWLMCRTCWAKVSPATQAEVYRTVKLRDMKSVDATWAPWWRAQAQAVYEVALQTPGLEGHTREDLPPWSAQAWLDNALAFAARLETPLPPKHTRASDGLMLQPMIDALAAIGPVTKEQLACALRVSHTTGSYQQKLGAVVRDGYAVKNSHALYGAVYQLTDLGQKKATSARVTGFLQFWLTRLEVPTGNLLMAIVRSGTQGLTKEAGAIELGVSHTTGSYQQRISRLTQLDLAVRKDGRLYAGPQATRRT